MHIRMKIGAYKGEIRDLPIFAARHLLETGGAEPVSSSSEADQSAEIQASSAEGEKHEVITEKPGNEHRRRAR